METGKSYCMELLQLFLTETLMELLTQDSSKEIPAAKNK